MVKHSIELDAMEQQSPCSSQGTDLPDIRALDVDQMSKQFELMMKIPHDPLITRGPKHGASKKMDVS